MEQYGGASFREFSNQIKGTKRLSHKIAFLFIIHNHTLDSNSFLTDLWVGRSFFCSLAWHSHKAVWVSSDVQVTEWMTGLCRVLSYLFLARLTVTSNSASRWYSFSAPFRLMFYSVETYWEVQTSFGSRRSKQHNSKTERDMWTQITGVSE